MNIRRFAALAILIGTPHALADRALITECTLDATPEEVWALFTTKQGWESCLVPAAEVDFRVGGTIRTNYDKAKGVGGEGTITHHILAYEPQRLIVTRFDAPPNAKKAQLAQQTACAIRIEPLADGRTRLIETMSGFGEGPEWDESYAFFKQGNEWTHEQIKKHFAKGKKGDNATAPVESADKALALMARFVGGEWVHEDATPDGGVFRTRKRFEFAPDGKSLIARGWLGDAKGMFAHGCTTIYKDPATGHAAFLDLNEQGTVTRGTIRAQGDNDIIWDWTGLTPDGTPTHYDVRFTLTGPDEHTGSITKVGADKPMVTLTAHRVMATPEKFLTLKSGAMETSTEARMMDPTLFAARGPVPIGVDKDAIVNAPPAEAFAAWTTPEGMKGFLGVESSIDLRIGGPFELFFGRAAGAPVGEQGSEGCRILSYIPNEMLCFSWNAPPKFAAERQRRTWVVVTFAPEGAGKTKVRLRHLGFGESGDWPQVREYFDNAWEKVLGAMKARYEPKPSAQTNAR